MSGDPAPATLAKPRSDADVRSCPPASGVGREARSERSRSGGPGSGWVNVSGLADLGHGEAPVRVMRTGALTGMDQPVETGSPADPLGTVDAGLHALADRRGIGVIPIVLSSAGALYAAIGAGNLRAYADTDAVGHAAIGSYGLSERQLLIADRSPGASRSPRRRARGPPARLAGLGVCELARR